MKKEKMSTMMEEKVKKSCPVGMKKEMSNMMEEKMKKKYPKGKEFYELKEEIGKGGCGVVHLADCMPLKEKVAIKIISLKTCDRNQVTEETQTMSSVDHPNIMNSHTSFTCDDDEYLWVVMPHMNGGSCLQILQRAFPDGIQDETTIATILHETLRGLQYLHGKGMLHRDVKGDNIFVDGSSGTIRLGDLGRCASLYDHCGSLHYRTSFAGTYCWMAPEVVKQTPYDGECDIWSLGITAIELAKGRAPPCWWTSNCCTPPTLQNEKGRKYSKGFRDFVKICLDENFQSRPSAEELLEHPFIRKAKANVSVVAQSLVKKKGQSSTATTTTGSLCSRMNKVLGLVRHFGRMQSIHTKVAPVH